jgi:putative flippase GtrA
MPVLSGADHDLVIVNAGKKSGSRVRGRVTEPARSTIYHDPNSLLQELGWHMTWMSGLIFSRRAILESRFEQYYDSSFLQIAVCFEWLAGKQINVYWESEPLVYAAGEGPPNWFGQAFRIFAQRWYETIISLPESYRREAKLICIKDHGSKSRCFSWKWLLSYRLFGYFDRQVFAQYKYYLPFVTDVPLPALYLLALLPVPRFFSVWLQRNAKMIKAVYDHKNIYVKHKQKVDYLLVGGWNTVFGYLTFLALYYLLSHRIHYLFLLVISNILSITNAYIGYKIFVFKTKGNYFREYLRFYVVYGSALALNLVLLPLCVEIFRLSPPLAQGILTFINVGFSYFGHKYFSFKVK